MGNRVVLLQAAISLLLLMSVKTSNGNLFSSLQFTRDALMGFFRGSERTVEMKIPVVNAENDTYKAVCSKLPCASPRQTSITYQTKRKTYRPRTSPSNKFLETVYDIERAAIKASASGERYSEATLTNLNGRLVTAIRRKSYTYAREVLGRSLYLLSTKTAPSGRRKRSSETDVGKIFLQNLRNKVGDTKFDSFMAVQDLVALMFVIDDTGSMADEIQAAKNIAIDIIKYQREFPVSYVLSPFNDPYPEGESRVIVKDEAEAGDFVKAINDLTANGGGDCPEYTFTGMVQALQYQVPPKGSAMYVFTDAGPKDASDELIEEVKLMAGPDQLDVTINFLLTAGGCEILHPAFKELADLTSGLVILLKDHNETEKLSDLMAKALEDNTVISIGTNKGSRTKRNAGGAADSRYSILVDESMETITVTVSTTRLDTNGQGITLTDPDDIIKTSEKLSMSQISVYVIDNPKRGVWTLVVSGDNGEHEFYVKSTSETNVDFGYYFTIPLRVGRRKTADVPVSSPVVGKEAKVLLTLAGSEKMTTSSLRLELITTKGTRIRDVTLQRRHNVYFTARITPPTDQPFRLKIRGTTLGGNSFERISRQTIKPTTTVLREKYASNDRTLPLKKVTFVLFELCNFGANDYFDVTAVKDELGYILSPNVWPRRVMKGRCTIISVRARATRSEDVDKTNTVFIVAKGRTSKAVVSQSARLLVV